MLSTNTAIFGCHFNIDNEHQTSNLPKMQPSRIVLGFTIFYYFFCSDVMIFKFSDGVMV